MACGRPVVAGRLHVPHQAGLVGSFDIPQLVEESSSTSSSWRRTATFSAVAALAATGGGSIRRAHQNRQRRHWSTRPGVVCQASRARRSSDARSSDAPKDRAARKERRSLGEADERDAETHIFWAEQAKPTIGSHGQPRRRVALALPEPLPDLHVRPESAEDAGEEAFPVAYSRVQSTVQDTDGAFLEVPGITTWAEVGDLVGLPTCLKAALGRRKFYDLTPVQQCTIPLLAAGRDVIATAWTGSGKTAAYLLPILTMLYHVARLQPGGTLVAAHYKIRDGSRSAKPQLGTVKGIRNGLAAIEFQQESGACHRQLVPPEWVVGAPEPPRPPPWQGPAIPRAVVLVPTRELSEQVHAEAMEFTCYTELRSVALFGSASLQSQLRNLAHGADVVVATPGRLIDILHRGLIRLDEVKHLVLDEVDRMLELGFGSQLEEIIMMTNMPTATLGRQTSFWSATIPPSVNLLAKQFLGKELVRVDCTGGTDAVMSTTIEHVLVDARPLHRSFRKFEPGMEVYTKGGAKGIAEMVVGPRSNRWRIRFQEGDLVSHKVVKKSELSMRNVLSEPILEDRLQLLGKVLQREDFADAAVIVFCRKRETVLRVYKFLKEKFSGVTLCHGTMGQSSRSKAVQEIRDGKADILVATDIAARGLDITRISHVINYELPLNMDDFIHRCGRTGRMGRRGVAVSFLSGREPIFESVIRTLRNQGERIPFWCSPERIQMPWRHRHRGLPFKKASVKPDASSLKRRQYRKNSLLQERTATAKRAQMASLLAQGVVQADSSLGEDVPLEA